MGCNVAPNCTNTLSCQRLWMCRLSFAGLPKQLKPTPPSSEPPKENETWFAKFMKGMKVEPLKGAYVLLIPVSCGESMVPPDVSTPICCRVADDGEILRISEGEIDGCVPNSDAAHWMLFGADAYYLYFWTFSKRIFKIVLREARADIKNVVINFEFSSFKVSQQELPLPEAIEKQKWELIDQNLQNVY